MFSVHAAWIGGAVEADIGAIRNAMNRTGGKMREATAPTAALPTQIAPFTGYRSTAIECLPLVTPIGGNLWIITY
jgi:hypothetical protein